jgi:hypothetical protein
MPPRRPRGLAGEEFRIWFNDQLEVMDDGCWIWTRTKAQNEYGSCRMIDGRIGRTHRIALELKLGRPIADGMHALHSCDNPPCCNPDHLWEGSNAENVRDKVEKGRQSKGEARSHLFRGERNGAAILTEDNVREILNQKGNMTEPLLAKQYGVSRGAISGIFMGTTWKHIPREN